MGLGGGQASFYAYVNSNPLSNIDPLGLESPSAACGGGPGTYAWDHCADIPVAPPVGCDDDTYWNRYWDNYANFVNQYGINIGPYAATMVGGVMPKTWAPATGFRGPLLGSSNEMTSILRGFGVRSMGGAIPRAGAAAIGVATIAIGIYDATIELEGFFYAIPD